MITRGSENMMIILLVIVLVIALAIVVYNYYSISDEEVVIDSRQEDENRESTEADNLEQDDSAKENSKEHKEKEKIYVHIAGEVKEPGVYKANSDDRLYKLIEKAGGISKQADLNQINLVDSLEDGARIIIPSVKKRSEKSESSTENLEDNKININQASKEELTTISGIGEVMAERIINYRQENNGFESTDELRQVSGIGEQTYQKIEEKLSH